MELKDYQTRVLADLASYLDTLDTDPDLARAFKQYWTDKGVRVGNDGAAPGIDPYKNTVPGVPHVCVKVPTAGGKTYIAVNALALVFAALARRAPQRPRMVVWLVPSLTILEQTASALANPDHPYRKKLDQLFSHRVVVYQKHELLMGAGFSLDTAIAQLSVVVMSFDSLRARNKEDRKIYHENGNLASFVQPDTPYSANWLLPDHDPSALINVIRRLRPVVIVDESHNAESALSVEMLGNLNPDFILDLTATPRENSNIISHVDALALKKQHMVKLPVIVANRSRRNEVIDSAIILRRQLEDIALRQAAAGGKYIRPIVLFQAQPRTDDSNTTFEKIRAQLIDLKIPAEQISIKTAEINELAGVDLLAPACPVRFIITVNALKEGWDCPFAYILASLADKTSAVDVEQILGRVLRMPHVQQHSDDLLNMSYVFTASDRFMDTLQSVVQGLNRAGFSDNDYRALEIPANGLPGAVAGTAQQAALFEVAVLPTARVNRPDERGRDSPALADPGLTVPALHASAGGGEGPVAASVAFVAQITQQALVANQAYEGLAQASDEAAPAALEDKMNRHRVKDIFKDQALALRLPQFFIKVPTGGWFDSDQPWQLFEHEELLKDFRLAQSDASIAFHDVDSEVYRVDLEKRGDADYAPRAFKLTAAERTRISAYLLNLPQASQQKNLVNRLTELIGNILPITDCEVKIYVSRIVGGFTPAQLRDCIERDVAYVRKIKQKIVGLSTIHAQKAFTDLLDVDGITLQAHFALPA